MLLTPEELEEQVLGMQEDIAAMEEAIFDLQARLNAYDEKTPPKE